MTRRDGFRAHLFSLGPFTEAPASFCPRGSPGRRETSWESSCAPFPYLPPPTVGSAPRPAGFPSELSLILPTSLHPCPQEHLHFCSCLDPHGPPPPSLLGPCSLPPGPLHRLLPPECPLSSCYVSDKSSPFRCHLDHHFLRNTSLDPSCQVNPLVTGSCSPVSPP